MKALFLTLLLFDLTFAITNLKGDISGQRFTKKGNPYIIEDELTISGDKETIIESGCLFLFKPFAGINITGSLIVRGTVKSPVIFTSIKNILYNEQDKKLNDDEIFDWNGIVIKEKAGRIELRNFEISSSIFGLKSNTNKIIVQQGIFKENGDLNFIIKDEMLDVKEGIPYDYGVLPVVEKGQYNLAKVVGISTLSISAAVFSSMGWSFYKANVYHDKYLKAAHSIQMEEYKHSQELCLKEAKNLGIIGAAFLSIGVGSFICSKKKDLTEITFYVLPKEIFLCLSINI